MNCALIRASQAFFAIFILSIPLSAYGARHRTVVVENGFLQILNTVFVVDYGVVCLSVVYWGNAACTHALSNEPKMRLLANTLAKYFLYFGCAMIFNVWFFGPSIVERLNVATGGYCNSSDAMIQSMVECRQKLSSQWIDGFDLSGHYYFLATSSLVLMDTVLAGCKLQNSAFDEYLAAPSGLGSTGKANIASKMMRVLAALLLLLWFIEFIITSIFFHTVWEKLSGLLGIPIAWGIISVSNSISNPSAASTTESVV